MTPEQLNRLKELAANLHTGNPYSFGEIVAYCPGMPEEIVFCLKYMSVAFLPEAYVEAGYLHYRDDEAGEWTTASVEGLVDFVYNLFIYPEKSTLADEDQEPSFLIHPDGSYRELDLEYLSIGHLGKLVSTFASPSTCSLEPKGS